MAGYYNRVILVGNLTRDPEIRGSDQDVSDPAASCDDISPRRRQGVQPLSHAQRPFIRSAPPLGHTGGTPPAIIIG